MLHSLKSASFEANNRVHFSHDALKDGAADSVRLLNSPTIRAFLLQFHTGAGKILAGCGTNYEASRSNCSASEGRRVQPHFACPFRIM